MFGFFFTDQPSVTCFDNVTKCDVERFKRFFNLMLKKKVFTWPPSAYEACFTSLAHGDKEIEATLDAADFAFATLAEEANA